ncbi:MAG: T9SS type A sorting domain-containing protein, partial [Candidatus Cloacimonetes bacterium]|nr:T9SS type A sorting domain-containing protein [Candidatus Cloacimonadota bacterium]
ITDNSADWNGGGIRYDTNSTSVLINCILWNNSPHEIYFDDYGLMSTVTISYSDIQGGEAGIVTNNNGTVNWLEGNIEEDPLFAGTGEDPYSLMEDSPCIDTGTPDTTGLNLPLCDIIGNLRIWDGDEDGIAIIDMGAYEYGAPPYVDVEHNLIVEVPGLIFKQNYPNPFNPETTINYQLPKNSEVELIICNIKGQRVKVLVNDFQDTGEHSIIWNGVDESGKPVSSGIYFYKLNVNGKIEAVRKCLLLK